MTVSRMHVLLAGALLPALLLALLLSVSGCAPLGAVVDDTGTGNGRSTYLSGEIRSLDTRRAVIQLREEYGRDHAVRYDNRTRVTWNQRQYPVSSLERGDRVRMYVDYDRNGTPWAERIEVRQNARATASRMQRIEGTIGAVDVRRGFFTVVQGRQSTVMVRVPNRAARDDIRRFERLRRGDRVRVEVRRGRRNEAELVRFR